MSNSKQLTLADEWKRAAAKNYRLYQRERKWTMGLAVFSGVLVLSWIIALTAMIASQPDSPSRYAKEPVSFTQEGYTPEYILACVKMKNGGTSCSGTVISKGEKYAAIVSAAHCVQGNIGGSCTWINPDKTEFEGELLAYDRKLDVCLFRAPVDAVLGQSYVPHQFPENAQKWEACGYTAGQGLKYKQVHPVKSNFVGKDYTYAVDEGPFGGGDSGGSVFADGGLVGVISACENSAAYKWNKMIIPGSSHANLVAFLRANEDKLAQCGPWGCPPQRRQEGYRQQPPGWNPGDNIPIIVPPNRPPQQPPTPPVPPPPPVEPYDDSKLQAEIGKIKELVDALQLKRGPEGPPGKDGKDGRDGKDGKSYDPAEMVEIKARLSQLENQPGYDDRKLIAELNVLRDRIEDMENRKPEDVTIYLQDARTKENLARPVSVAPGSKVVYPVDDFLVKE